MKKTLWILTTTLALCTSVYAIEQVVRSGETETSPITLANDGDGALIEEGGTLSTGASNGIDMNNNNQTALNNGTLSTTGASARGISNGSGNNATITNNGTISTTGGTSAYGILTAVVTMSRSPTMARSRQSAPLHLEFLTTPAAASPSSIMAPSRRRVPVQLELLAVEVLMSRSSTAA